MMNDFEILCKRLENGKKYCFKQCYETNNYLCAKNAVLHYIGQNDKSKLLQLKAEAQEGLFREYFALLISFLSMFASTVTLFVTIKVINDFIIGLLVIVLLILLIYTGWFIRKFSCVNKWRGYIKVAIDEIEKELGRKIQRN